MLMKPKSSKPKAVEADKPVAVEKALAPKEPTFVLNYVSDVHARAGLLAYAYSVQRSDPKLSAHLMEEANKYNTKAAEADEASRVQ